MDNNEKIFAYLMTFPEWKCRGSAKGDMKNRAYGRRMTLGRHNCLLLSTVRWGVHRSLWGTSVIESFCTVVIC
jgi:hypothetical protein